MPLSRRNFRIALLTFVAAALMVILFALDHAISHRRWPVTARNGFELHPVLTLEFLD
jgi:hypothetical protein